MSDAVDPTVDWDQLKARARRHRRSLEEEARELLRAAIAREASGGETLPAIAERLFGAERGIDLDLPPREQERERPQLGFGSDVGR